MATIAIPTLVIGNGEDFVHPLAYAKALAGLIPAAQLRVIISKNVSVERYTQEFTEALADFLVEEAE